MKVTKIIKINENISNFIFNLRNKDYVRKNSLNTLCISLKSHNVWIKNFLKKNNKLYIISEKKLPIGYVRLQRERGFYNTSWALTKKYHGKGYAKNFLKLSTRNKLFRYKAIIKEKNTASLKIALYAKFTIKRKINNIFYFFKN